MTPEQLPVSEYISASAGSGKTYALSSRFTRLVAAGVAPEAICALTFTRAAAREIFSAVMQRLLEFGTDADLRRMTEALPHLSVYTIDAFSVLLARLFAYELGISPDLTLYDDNSRPEGDDAGREIIRRAMRVDPGKTPSDILALLDIGRAGEDHVGNLGQNLWIVLRTYGGLTRDTLPGDWGNTVPFGLEVLPTEERYCLLERLAASDFSACPPGQQRKLLDAIARYPDTNESIRHFSAHIGDAWFGDNQFGALCNGSVTVRGKTYAFDERTKQNAQRLWNDLCARDIREAAWHTAKLRQALNRLCAAREDFTETTGTITFDDLTDRLGRMLGKALSFANPHLLNVCYRLNASIRHLMIDEFQDTSASQWRVLSNFASELASGDDSTFYYVGDTKQSIYGWRGGDSSLFGDPRRLPPIPKGPSLDQSHRSSPAVIDLVNDAMLFPKAVFSTLPDWMDTALCAWRKGWRVHSSCHPNRPGYAAVLTLEGGTKTEWFECLVAYLVKRIRALRRSGQRLSIAVLALQNSVFVPDPAYGDDQGGGGLLERLRAHDIPCAVDGKRSIADTALGRWFVAWLRWLDEPHADLCHGILRESALPDAFTDEAALRWNRLLFESGAPVCLERLLAENVLTDLTGYDRETLEWVRDAFAAGERAGERNPGILASRLEGMVVPCTADDSVVSLMTVHRSKGLTFDVVFTVLSGAILNLRNDSALECGENWVLEQPVLEIAREHPELKSARKRRFLCRANDFLSCLYVGVTRARYEQTVLAPEKEVTTVGSRASVFCRPFLVAARNPRTEPLFLQLQQDTKALTPAKVIAEYGALDWTGKLSCLQESAEHMGMDIAPAATGNWSCVGPDALAETELPSESARACAVSEMLTQGHGGARRRGISYHDRLAEVGWSTNFPVFTSVFTRPKVPCTLWRERPFTVSYSDPCCGVTRRIAGQFDRVHLFKDHAVIYDFKTGLTDEVTPAYRKQMEDYRCALTVLTGLPPEAIRTVLLFTRSETAVEIKPGEYHDRTGTR